MEEEKYLSKKIHALQDTEAVMVTRGTKIFK